MIKSNLKNKITAIALAGSTLLAPQAKSEIIPFTLNSQPTIYLNLYAIEANIGTRDLTSFKLPTGLNYDGTNSSQSSIFACGGGEDGNWLCEYAKNPVTNLLDIIYSGSPIRRDNQNVSFAYIVNQSAIPLGDLTLYNTRDVTAILGGNLYDSSNNTLPLYTFDLTSPKNSPAVSPVPEPESGLLMGTGLLALLALSRKRTDSKKFLFN